MKNPNGAGSIIKLSGARRKPYAVRVTTGFANDKKRKKRIQKQRYLGYYETKKDALAALGDYNKGFFNADLSGITFAEHFERFLRIKKDRSASTQAGYQLAFDKSAPLHNMALKSIVASHMQACIDEAESRSMRNKMKSLYSQMFVFAMDDDIVLKNYAANLSLGSDDTKEIHGVISDITLKILWDNVDEPFADFILITVMTGMRAGELRELRTENIYLEDRYMIGGGKTKAGKDRVIPIHPAIVQLIEKRLDGEYLFELNGKMYERHNIAPRLRALNEKLGTSIKSHDGRVTFVTNMRRAGADYLAVKRIVGHADRDVTEKVYTKTDIQELIAEVDKLTAYYKNILPVCNLPVSYRELSTGLSTKLSTVSREA